MAVNGRAATKATGPAVIEAVAVATDTGLPAPALTDSRRKVEGRRAQLRQPSQQVATTASLPDTAARGGEQDNWPWTGSCA